MATKNSRKPGLQDWRPACYMLAQWRFTFCLCARGREIGSGVLNLVTADQSSRQ